MEDIADFADRLIVMDKGRIFMDGRPKDVFMYSAELEEIGLSAPQVTYIMQELYKRGFHVDVNATTVGEAADSILAAVMRNTTL